MVIESWNEKPGSSLLRAGLQTPLHGDPYKAHNRSRCRNEGKLKELRISKGYQKCLWRNRELASHNKKVGPTFTAASCNIVGMLEVALCSSEEQHPDCTVVREQPGQESEAPVDGIRCRVVASRCLIEWLQGVMPMPYAPSFHNQALFHGSNKENRVWKHSKVRFSQFEVP